MHAILVIGLFAVGLSMAAAHGNHGQCIYRRDKNGNRADCGGFVGRRCPSATDRCQRQRGSTMGYCCLGCWFGTPTGTCNIFDPIFNGCPFGRFCSIKGNIPPSSVGVCCPFFRG